MKTIAGLMELHGENDFKTKSYTNAAFQLGRIQEHVMTLDKEVLDQKQGIGKSIAAKIIELRETGTIAVLDELMAITPPGLIEILKIKGLGGKKVGVIWRDLGIETIGELLYACHENRLAKLKGFGEKTQDSVIQSIEYYQSNQGKFRYAAVADIADNLVSQLIATSPNTNISLCGSIRRKCNVVEGIEILVGGAKADLALNKIADFEVTDEQPTQIKAKAINEIPVTIYLVSKASFCFELFCKTGSESIVEYIIPKLNGETTFESEAAIFNQAGMTYLLPELREAGLPEINEAALITMGDLKGIVHNHSTWSDGKNTIAEMAAACKLGGYEYFVLSDHSKTAVYAGGLTELQIIEQHKEIDKLNNSGSIKIFKSIECDILFDGTLDYTNEVLSTFDLVIVSVHQHLKMDIDKATQRLLAAIENPYTTILGHMTGRLLLSRPGYPVDHKKIIDACAANDVVIEINANPYRLDIDHMHIPYALEKGVMISINPDAHSVEGIQDVKWGTISARKGGLTEDMCWNAMSLVEVDNWLTSRKKKKGIL